MKRGTIDNPKTARLAAALGLETWGAVGILESLWHFAARHAIRGDVGRWTDEDIANAIGWKGDSAVLIEALVKSRWLDKSKKHRLLVHDWHDHADQSVSKTLRNRSETFLTFPEKSRNGKPQPGPGPGPEPLPEPGPGPEPLGGPCPDPDPDKSLDWPAIRELANRVATVVPAAEPNDRALILKACILVDQGRLSRNCIEGAMESTAAKAKGNKAAYFTNALRGRAKDLHRINNLDSLFASVPDSLLVAGATP